MLPKKFTGISPGTLYSFFPRNKHLKISKQDIHIINNKQFLNKIKFNSKNSNDSFNINGKNYINENKVDIESHSSNKNPELANSKWNYKYESNSNQPKNKFASLASSTGKDFFRNSTNNLVQSSYGKKNFFNKTNNNGYNGYQSHKNLKKKNLKMIVKKGISYRVPDGGLRVTSVEKNSMKKRIIERFVNQYESNVKKVLYEMGVVKDIQDSTNQGLKNYNWNTMKSSSTKGAKKIIHDNDLPILSNQKQNSDKCKDKVINELKKRSNNGHTDSNSETNIININNFINFFSDANNITTYNNNNNTNKENYILRNYVHNNINNHNNFYDSATDTTLNNNLASESINSNIGNNNIIFGNSSKKNSFHQFSFNTKNIKSKSRASNSLNSAYLSNSNPKKIISDNSANIIGNNLLSPNNKEKEKKEISNYVNNNYKALVNQKKFRTSSTGNKFTKLYYKKEETNSKEHINNANNTNINNYYSIKDNNNYINKSNLSSSNYYTNKYKEDKLSKYNIGDIIGKGAYAVVKLVTNKYTKIRYAMKIYDKEKLNDSSKKKCVYCEIEILKRVNHKNIANLIEVINTSDQILIIQEYVDGISLRDYYNKEIRNQKGISEHKSKIFKKIFKQIFEAMNYLHKNHIAHRDIKLENILMTKQYYIKIIDFGFGMYNPENKLQCFFCGTPNYMPPEIAFKKPYVGQKADLWSLGVLLFKMFCADFPFKGKNEKELYKNIKKGQFIMANYTPDYIRNIIVNMIEIDPDKRLTCEDVLKSDWLKG